MGLVKWARRRDLDEFEKGLSGEGIKRKRNLEERVRIREEGMREQCGGGKGGERERGGDGGRVGEGGGRRERGLGR